MCSVPSKALPKDPILGSNACLAGCAWPDINPHPQRELAQSPGHSLADGTAGIHVTACGHAMHSGCHTQYMCAPAHKNDNCMCCVLMFVCSLFVAWQVRSVLLGTVPVLFITGFSFFRCQCQCQPTEHAVNCRCNLECIGVTQSLADLSCIPSTLSHNLLWHGLARLMPA